MQTYATKTEKIGPLNFQARFAAGNLTVPSVYVAYNPKWTTTI